MAAKKEDKENLQKKEEPISERFANAVVREFSSNIGVLQLSPLQKRLAQHLFIHIDTALKALESKRKDQNKTPIVWSNINMEKLAIDAVHRIELGLDALIPNHISTIPYLNGRTKKYDLDLRIGYVGKDLYRRQMAFDPPVDIIYELVYENDTFKPIKKSYKNPIETYDFNIAKPFDRGEIIGGFAYLVYQNEEKNQLVIVTEKDFLKSRGLAQSKSFWDEYPEPMRYKSLVTKATNRLQISPEKVNASFAAVESDETDQVVAQAEIDENANSEEVIDVDKAVENGNANVSGKAEPEAEGDNGLYDVEKCGACPGREVKKDNEVIGHCGKLDNPEEVDACKGVKGKKGPGF